MIEKKFDEYTIEELESELGRRRDMEEMDNEIEKLENDRLSQNFGFTDEQWHMLNQGYSDINWSEASVRPWYIISENEDEEISGISAVTIEDAEEMIDELYRSSKNILFILKDGMKVDFCIELIINIRK